MKKFAAFLFAMVFTLIQTTFIYAEINPLEKPLAGLITGTIVNETATTIEVQPANEGDNLVINLGEKPVVVDCLTGQPLALKERRDDYIAAYYGPAAALSMPPQSNAIVVICDIPQDYKLPHYGRVESIERAAGQVKVTIDNGSLIVAINKDTPIFPYLTKNIVTTDVIDIGADLLMWYPIVGMSFPAQATAEKVLYLGSSVSASKPGSGIEIELQIGNRQAAVNGIKISLDAPPIILNSRTMLPSRFIAENLNCNVDWNDEKKTVTITSGTSVIELQIGNTEAKVNGAKVTLDAPPMISNDRTMLPARFIAENLNCTVGWDAATRTVTIRTGLS